MATATCAANCRSSASSCVRERALDFVQQIQRADDLAFASHRHGELRQHVAQRPHVARLTANVVDENRAAFLHRGADHALSERQPQRRRHLLRDNRPRTRSQLLSLSSSR